jgi:hypothetical protein
MSGAKRSPCGPQGGVQLVEHDPPASTRAHRSAALTSSNRLKYLDVSICSPAPIACPACDVPAAAGGDRHAVPPRDRHPRARHRRASGESRRRAVRSGRRWRRWSRAHA